MPASLREWFILGCVEDFKTVELLSSDRLACRVLFGSPACSIRLQQASSPVEAAPYAYIPQELLALPQ